MASALAEPRDVGAGVEGKGWGFSGSEGGVAVQRVLLLRAAVLGREYSAPPPVGRDVETLPAKYRPPAAPL